MPMFQIQNVLVTLDIVERFFCCDLSKCLGACCIEGDAGAPVTPDEAQAIANAMPDISSEMLPRAVEEVQTNGTAYRDSEGDLVTTLLDGRNCAFCTFAPGGVCLCAIEKCRRQGRTNLEKPISCALYPLRERPIGPLTALNYHRWDICRPAEECGRARGIRLYQFLREPLVRRFGQQWYDELALTCQEYLRQYPS